MISTVIDLEKAVNSDLTTSVKKSEISFDQLFIEVQTEDIISVLLFLNV